LPFVLQEAHENSKGIVQVFGTCRASFCRVFPTSSTVTHPSRGVTRNKQGQLNTMNVTTTTSPSRRLAWAAAAILAIVGLVGLALTPRVAAAIPRTAIQMVYAWLCASLVGSAYVVVTLANDTEGALEDGDDH